MGRKSTRNQRQQQRMSRAANARDPRFDSYEEETTYGYATHRVKHQRYPQPIPATTPVLRMNRRVELYLNIFIPCSSKNLNARLSKNL
jgi:hypothetical protein